MISIVSPVYNEEGNLLELCRRVVETLEKGGEDFELILVDDGSRDRSLEIMKSLRAQDSRIKYVSLSRNFGHQAAILAGLTHASGDAVISMDGDLQHPPELIPKMIQLWKEGHEVVFTVKEKASYKGWLFFFTRIFYKLMNAISEVNLLYGQSDFRLLDRKVVEIICQIPERHKFFRALVQWVGFRQTYIEYKVDPRKEGKSKFSFRGYISYALDCICPFSTIPLRIFLWTGVAVGLLCILYTIYLFLIGFTNLFVGGTRLIPPGWLTLAVSVMFLGAVQLIGLGVLGEYIGRTYSQTKQRPDFIVRDKELD